MSEYEETDSLTRRKAFSDAAKVADDMRIWIMRDETIISHPFEVGRDPVEHEKKSLAHICEAIALRIRALE